MKIIEKSFECMKGNMTIRGIELHRDDSEGKLVPVIISHGFTSSMKSTKAYGEFLAEQGYRAFVFDFCGGGFETISDGSFEDYMTPVTEIDDLKAVVKYVTARDDVIAEKLVLMGCSQGGFVSGICAAELKEEVFALVMFFPALCIPDDARAGSMQIIRFDPHNIPDHIGVPPMRISGAYARSVNRMDIFEELAPYRGNVLITHGTADMIVNYQYSIDAKETYKKAGTPCELHLLEGAPHGYQGEDEETAKAILKDYLEKLLRNA